MYDNNYSLKRRSTINNLLRKRPILLGVLIVVIAAFMSALYPSVYFSFNNFTAILLSVSSIGVLSIGMILLIISGEFDLSIGANLAVGATVAGFIMNRIDWVPFPIAMIAGIAASTLAGLVNGLIVSKVGVNALIGTFSMMGILRAIATAVSKTGFVGLPPGFLKFGQTVFLGIQTPVFYMLFLVVVFSFLVNNTRYFRKLYFIGGNLNAAKLSGINVTKEKIINFMIMGALAGFTGVVMIARLNFAMGDLGGGIELQVIAAAIIGGGSLAGGIGTIEGAFLGALFVAVIQNALVIGGVNVYIQGVIVGLVLIIAASFDILINRRNSNF